MVEGRVSTARIEASLVTHKLGARVLPAFVLACGACSPVSFAVHARAAESAVEAAESAQSDKYASYELVHARVLLDKAHEEASEAHYALALDLAERAEQSARRARALAHARSAGARE